MSKSKVYLFTGILLGLVILLVVLKKSGFIGESEVITEVETAKANEITEDEEKQAEDKIQKITDKFVGEIEKLVESKEKEVMEV